MVRQFLLMMLLAGVLVACAEEAPVCSEPYILQGGKCCMDADGNGVCDSMTQTKLDCSLCPPQFVTQKEEVIVYKYVCDNQSVVDKPEECARIVSNAHLFEPKTEQDPAYIKEFSILPACRGKFQAGEAYLEYVEAPLNITFQVLDEPEGEFRNAGSVPVQNKIFYYIGFCKDCQNLINLQLEPGQAYLVRAKLQYEKFSIYTAERLIDPTPTGAIGRKVCS